MKRRTLDLIFSAGGVAFALLLLVLGLVLQNQANFAKNYVHDQLSAQKIVFTPAANLTDDEKKADCLVANGGKALTTGRQAECYANEYIALHLEEAATAAGYPGETYASIGGAQRTLRTQVADLTKANDPTLPDVQKKLDAVNSLRTTMFQGETLRGLLLTSFGFSIFGERAQTAAYVAFIAAGLMLLLSIAGFVHALVTPKNKTVGVVSASDKEMATV